MATTTEEWIRELSLQPHPEGGWYREVYRASEAISQAALPARFCGDRSFSTAIYYLLGPNDFSALHRIKQDEVWHFYDGSTLTIHTIAPSGQHESHRLGRNPIDGDLPMVVIPAGVWFGAEVDDPSGYTLVGCTVAPGFDFADFCLATRAELVDQFPARTNIINRLTRQSPPDSAVSFPL